MHAVEQVVNIFNPFLEMRCVLATIQFGSVILKQKYRLNNM